MIMNISSSAEIPIANIFGANHVRVCLEPVNSTSVGRDVRALVLYCNIIIISNHHATKTIRLGSVTEMDCFKASCYMLTLNFKVTVNQLTNKLSNLNQDILGQV